MLAALGADGPVEAVVDQRDHLDETGLALAVGDDGPLEVAAVQPPHAVALAEPERHVTEPAGDHYGRELLLDDNLHPEPPALRDRGVALGLQRRAELAPLLAGVEGVEVGHPRVERGGTLLAGLLAGVRGTAVVEVAGRLPEAAAVAGAVTLQRRVVVAEPGEALLQRGQPGLRVGALSECFCEQHRGVHLLCAGGGRTAGAGRCPRPATASGRRTGTGTRTATTAHGGADRAGVGNRCMAADQRTSCHPPPASPPAVHSRGGAASGASTRTECPEEWPSRYHAGMLELTVTELRNRLLDVIRRVESGKEEVVVTRHGKRVARIAAIRRPPCDQLDVDRGRLRITDPDDPLLTTDEVWELE